MFRYLSYIITFSSRKTLSKVKTREAKTCNYVKSFQKRGTSRSSTLQCYQKIVMPFDLLIYHWRYLLSKGSLLRLISAAKLPLLSKERQGQISKSNGIVRTTFPMTLKCRTTRRASFLECFYIVTILCFSRFDLR